MLSAMTVQISPIKLEMLRNALIAAAEEMAAAVFRTSRSTTVREMLDYSTAVFDAQANVIGQSSRIPMHLNTMAPCLEVILKEYIHPEDLEDGDVILINDPFCGAQHLPDVTTFKPVFVDGALLGFTGAMLHYTDVGGAVPGSYNAAARDIFAEGVRIPPVRIVRKGAWNDDLLKMFLQNVRDPETVKGDLLSQIASCVIGEKNLHRLVQKYGADFIATASRQLLDQSEAEMRRRLAQIPEGVFTFKDKVDDDGLSDTSYEIAVKVTVRPGAITIDFNGSADQAEGSINCTFNITRCCVYYAVMAAVGGDIPANSGCYRPIEVIAPKGSITNCDYPAAVVNRITVGHRLVNAIMGALAKAMPDRIPAAYYSASFALFLETVAENGARSIYMEADIGGWGGEPGRDGASALSAGLHNINTVPLEMLEAKHPVTFTRFALRPDSGGLGEYRGGLGTVREYRLDAPRALLATSGDRVKFGPYGVRGGMPGGTAVYAVHRADGTTELLPSKAAGIHVRQGDRVMLMTAGGGGYGDPRRRDNKAVEADLSAGYITKAAG